MPAQRRNPGIIALGAAHGCVQQQDRCTLPGFGEVVDVIGELHPVACLEGLHCNLPTSPPFLPTPRRSSTTSENRATGTSRRCHEGRDLSNLPAPAGKRHDCCPRG